MKQIPNCCDGREGGRGRAQVPFSPSEQNPQVPLASEDALAQVPGNAETAVGLFFHPHRHPHPQNFMQKGQSTNQLNNTGARALLIAVIEQVVNDFKELAAAGRIVNGTVTPGKAIRGYETEADIQALLDFFHSDVMDEWIFLARVKINPNFIREKLGLPHQKYDLYCP
jgi:hypothetical protein